MRFFQHTLSAGLLAGSLSGFAGAATANENVMVVFDGSNSMWGQIEGVAKIEIARSVMDNLLGEWTEERQVGLMAYGHRRRGDCTDIETLVQPGAAARDTILERINGITPTGKTPLSDAVEQAAISLSYTDQPATVVLISDGLESCDRDPCALAEALEKAGVQFTAHVVGFGLGGDADTASLSCIAENTGGQFISASNADELGAALSTVGTAVAEAEPEPVVEPEPEPEPELPSVVVTGPETAITGADFDVAWDPSLSANDYVTIVPVGADEGTYGNNLQVKDKTEGTLRAPADTGLYELRYVDRKTGGTLGTTPIEIVDPEVTVTAPEFVLTGQEFDVSYTGVVHPADYVTIVPVGADEGTYGKYQVVQDKSERTLTAPADPGLYEVRYILREGAKTVASTPVEVREAEITISAPEQVTTGAEFDVSYTGAVAETDYVTIVPAGADEGSYGHYQIVRDATERKLKAPADPGLYEVRYILREGARTMASQPVEVVDAQVTISAPESVTTGAKFKVSYTGAVANNDYVTIVPAGADEGTYGNYQVVKDETERTLKAPADPGLYEVRYILREGTKTMARQTVEVVAAEVTISGPQVAITGSEVMITWTNAVDAQDYINIVPMGTDEGKFGNYFPVRDRSDGKLRMPSEVGMYELRYVLREGNKTLATQPIEITAPEITVTAPEAAMAGETLRVSWTGAVSPQDYINIVPAGTDEGKFGSYISVRDKGEGDVQVPGDPGLYEIRYVLREGNKTMVSVPLEVALGEVTIEAPDQIRLGDKLRVNWTGAISPRDYINLVPLGTDDDTYGFYVTVGDKTQQDMRPPETVGMYEIRYMLNSNKRVMARRVVEVLPADAALNTGASLDAPETGAAGSVISVGWSVEADSADQRITLAQADQPIFTWIEAVKIAGEPPVEITLPDSPGMYELRFLDVSNQEVLARQVITVE